MADMTDMAVARGHGAPQSITAGVVRRADDLELAAGVLGVLVNAVWFSVADIRLIWPAYLFLSLGLGFVAMMMRDTLRRSLSDAEFDDDGLFLGQNTGLFLGVMALQCLGSFFLMGVYGILIAVVFF